jgi:phosphatidylinositol-3-phosphatase
VTTPEPAAPGSADPQPARRRHTRPPRIVAATAAVAVVALGLALYAYGVPGVSCRAEEVAMTPAAPQPAEGRPPLQHVFVIVMENTGARDIYDGTGAPYLHSLLERGAHATNYRDPLALGVLSEPHYVWMEAGTNRFADARICADGDPSARNSTASTDHLTTQMATAASPVSWTSYQEGLDPSTTGVCPVDGAGHYAPKHDPFVFFQDVAGSPPAKDDAGCAAHHRASTALNADLASGDVADYVFLTPDLCHDMHDQCAGAGRVPTGDAWLKDNLPPVLDFADAHDSVVFLAWDEGDPTSKTMPFFAFGPSVAAGRASGVTVTHSSLLRTIEELFGLPILPTVAGASDLADLFVGGRLPLRSAAG